MRLQLHELPAARERNTPDRGLRTAVESSEVRPSTVLGKIAIAGAAGCLTRELLARVLADRPVQFLVAGGPGSVGTAVITSLYAPAEAATVSINAARAAAEVIESLPAGARAVLDREDSLLRRYAKHCPAPVTWVGTSLGCHLRARDVEETIDDELYFHVAGRSYRVPGCSVLQLTCALSAIAVGRMAGLADAEIAVRLNADRPRPARPNVRFGAERPAARSVSLPIDRWRSLSQQRAA